MIVLQGYLHFGTGSEPRQTVSVPVREADAPRSGQTVYGYGSKMPTPYMVKWEGRWRRVYAARYGNAGTTYIGKPGAWLATVDVDHA